MKRVLSIWFPHLAIERWAKSSDLPPDAPIVLTVEGPHGLIIHAMTASAAERGASRGARLTDARALDPMLVAAPADREGDMMLVQRFAKWAGRWSPLVEVDGDGLRLDATGIVHLFGGDEGLVGNIQSCFAKIAFSTHIAIAPTAASAWALAHHAPCICSDDIAAKLAPLHVSALRLGPRHGADARTARPQNDRRSAGSAANGACEAVSRNRGRDRRARPGVRSQTRSR